MTRGVPTIDPKMFGDATPEDVARALLAPVRKPVAGDKVTVEKPAPDKPGDGVPHLAKRV